MIGSDHSHRRWRWRPNFRGIGAVDGTEALSVAGALAAVDMQDLAGDERRGFQEQHGIDDVAGFSHAADRMQRGKEVMCLWSMHRGLDDAGRNGVNPDALP